MLTEYRPETLSKNEILILESIYCELFTTGIILKDELAMLLTILSRGNIGINELKMRLKCGLPAIKGIRKSLEALRVARFINNNDNRTPMAVLILPTISLRDEDFDKRSCMSQLSKIITENRIKYDNKNYNTNLIIEHSNNTLDASIFIRNFFKRIEEISTIENNPDSLIISHPIINYHLPEKNDPNFWWHVTANSIRVDGDREADDLLDADVYRKVIRVIESYMGKNSMDIFREKWRDLHNKKEEYANLVFYNKESNNRFGKDFKLIAPKKQEEVVDMCKELYVNYDEPEYQEHQKYGIDFAPFTDNGYIDMVNYFGEIPLDIYQKIIKVIRDKNQWTPTDMIIKEWKEARQDAKMLQKKEETIGEDVLCNFSFISNCQEELKGFYFDESFIKNVDEKINHDEFIKIYGGSTEEYTKQIFAILKDCEDRGKTPEESIEEIREMFVNE